MKKSVLKMWTDALRSGEYKQGKFGLRDLDDHFDAVGVLCDLAAGEGICKAEKYDKPEARVFFGWTYDGDAVRLPASVGEWSGLSFWSANRVLTLNDKGKKFAEIADYLEKKYG